MTSCHKATIALLLLLSTLELKAQTENTGPMNQSGFFVTAQAGRSSGLHGADQQVNSIGLGYRWGLGQIALLGFEVDAGREESNFGSVGLNARLNIGLRNPVFARARAVFWADGGSGGPFLFAGVGVGVDLGRNFNVNAMFSSYQYRGEVATAGLEIRF